MWPLNQALKYFGILLGHKIKTPLTGPIHGSIFVTYACDLDCVFCDYPQKHLLRKQMGNEELTTQEMKNVISDFHRINTTVIAFTGGEPILRKDILELIEFTSKKGMLTHLSSNGLAFRSYEQTKKVFEAGLDATSISIDSPIETIHDTLRGKQGSFNQVINAIKNVQAYKKNTNSKISLTTTTVINEENIDCIDELIDLLRNLGVDQIGFVPDHDLTHNYTPENRKKYLTKRNKRVLDAIDRLIERAQTDPIIENTIGYLRLIKSHYNGMKLPIPCYAGYSTLAVDSWGEIFPCFTFSYMEKSYGNIRSTSLYNFWKKSNGSAKMRSDASSCRDCYWNHQTEINLLFEKLTLGQQKK